MKKKHIGQMRVLDMHAHLSCLTEEYGGSLSEEEKYELGMQELALRRQYGIVTFFSSGTPGEWEFMRCCLGKYEESDFLLSYGIHPWYADRYRPEDFWRYLEQCDAIGEIGMDSVWCDVPLTLQARIFSQQLDLAADLKKPVVLHTKGQEAQIARMIRDFPGKVCVHWYSGDMRSFEAFLDMGCYFTLGPDLEAVCVEEKEPAAELYREMLQMIPTDRLFLETDGISAVAWAREVERLELEEIPAVLEKNLAFAAAWKQMTARELSGRMQENLREFMSH